MARKLKADDLVKVRLGAPSPFDGYKYAAKAFHSTRGYGIVTAVNPRVVWPIDVAAGKRGEGETWCFDAAELDLISRPKAKQKGGK